MAIIPGVYQAKNAISDNSQQGSKFNSIVNAIVNPANTSLLTGFDSVIEEVSSPNVGTVVTYMPQTVSGTPPLSLPNSAGQPLESWSVDVSPYQEGSGDPSPDNVRPIHGTDKLTITTAGKNLFDAGTHLFVTGKYINAANGNEGSGTNTCACLDYTETPPYNFTISCVENVQGRIAFYDETQTYISGTYSVVNVTPPNGAKYFRFSFTADTVSNVMMEFGSTATDYTPYVVPSQTVLTLPQTVYTGTIGSDGGESRSAVVDLGTLTWTPNGTDSLYGAVPNKKRGSQYGRCTALKQVSSSTSSGVMPNGSYKCYSNSNDIAIKLPGITPANASTMLSGMMFEYELATSVQFPLTAPPIPTPTGTATTWATAEDGTVESMEVTYLGT